MRLRTLYKVAKRKKSMKSIKNILAKHIAKYGTITIITPDNKYYDIEDIKTVIFNDMCNEISLRGY